MSSDTDETSSSYSADDLKIRKTKKKTEKKSKKQKKEKKKKKEKREKKRKLIDPEINAELPYKSALINMPTTTIQQNIVSEEEETFGPALPPHLMQKQNISDSKETVDKQNIIGPNLPERNEYAEHMTSVTENTTTDTLENEDNADFCFGPMPVTAESDLQQMSAKHIELEQRALELKLAAIEGATVTNVDQKVREEWMLELPEVGLKGGLAALSNMKRTFHQGKERPDFSDRSAWTKTPNSDTSNMAISANNSKIVTEKLKNSAQALYERQRDEEQERLAKKHKKKHKRDESLLEMHQKKLRKEQRKKEKELAASGSCPERRPFSRDVDLKLNKIDKNQTKQIVDKAKILNTKFGSGQTKYL